MGTVDENLSGKSQADKKGILSAVAAKQGLRELKFSFADPFDDADIRTICQIIQSNPGLTVLELRGCGLRNPQVEMICNALCDMSRSMKLTDLILASNDITDKGMTSICAFVKSSTTLEYLDIANNRITHTGLVGCDTWFGSQPGIITTLAKLDFWSLRCVHFVGNKLHEDNYRAVCKKLYNSFQIDTDPDVYFSERSLRPTASMGAAPIATDNALSTRQTEVTPASDASQYVTRAELAATLAEFKKQFKAELLADLRDMIRDVIKTELREIVKTELPGIVKAELREILPGIVKAELREILPGIVKAELPGIVKAELREILPGIVKAELREILPGIVKAELPGVVKAELRKRKGDDPEEPDAQRFCDSV